MIYILKIKIEFLYSKYYATSWGSQVNEGKVDWPPAPWRFLRSLVSSWYSNNSINHNDYNERNKFEELLNLFTDLPIYELPRVSISSTRHYMETGNTKQKKDKKFKGTVEIINPFIVLPKDKFIVLNWLNINLDKNQEQLLSKLLESINYFGRSESIAKLSILKEEEALMVNENKDYIEAKPENLNLADSKEAIVVKTIACMDKEEYKKWKEEVNDSLVETSRKEDKSKLLPRKEDKSKLLPDTLIDILSIETAKMKIYGWGIPPGSKWVNYILDEKAYMMDIKLSKDNNNYNTAYFSLYSKNKINPKYIINIAEKVHRALIKNSNGEAVFTGCNNIGQPLKGNKHSFIFLINNIKNKDKFITNMVIYAPMGFNQIAEMSLDRLISINNYSDKKIIFFLIKIGNENDFPYLSLFSKSKRWKSVTPFVPTMHPKFNSKGPKIDQNTNLQKGSPEYNLIRLIKNDDRFNKVSIKNVKCKHLSKSEINYLIGFKLDRKEGVSKTENGRRSTNLGYYMEVEFDKEVAGPLAFGYGNHFGLGLFEPIK